MKITCTHCQAGYNVDLPEIKPEGVEFKCVKCEQKFLVTPQNTDQPKEKVATAASAPSGGVSESGEEKERHAENQSSSEEKQQPPPEGADDLDGLLDDLMADDIAETADTETTETDTEDDLDDILNDSLIPISEQSSPQ